MAQVESFKGIVPISIPSIDSRASPQFPLSAASSPFEAKPVYELQLRPSFPDWPCVFRMCFSRPKSSRRSNLFGSRPIMSSNSVMTNARLPLQDRYNIAEFEVGDGHIEAALSLAFHASLVSRPLLSSSLILFMRSFSSIR